MWRAWQARHWFFKEQMHRATVFIREEAAEMAAGDNFLSAFTGDGGLNAMDEPVAERWLAELEDVNRQIEPLTGRAALHVAVSELSPAWVRKLLAERGADPLVEDASGAWPSQMAKALAKYAEQMDQHDDVLVLQVRSNPLPSARVE